MSFSNPLSIKLGAMFTVTIILAIFFSILYHLLSDISFGEAMYKSVSIQTIGGEKTPAKNTTEKVITSIQHLLAFMIFSGLIIISIKIPDVIHQMKI